MNPAHLEIVILKNCIKNISRVGVLHYYNTIIIFAELISMFFVTILGIFFLYVLVLPYLKGMFIIKMFIYKN